MNVSREFTVQELESVRKVLGQWLRELKAPDGYGDDGPPAYVSVNQIESIGTNQLRAELIACAAKLEAVAGS